jgi:hypothetical protein
MRRSLADAATVQKRASSHILIDFQHHAYLGWSQYLTLVREKDADFTGHLPPQQARSCRRNHA